ncbi:DUF3618 domain-containing protein [Nostocoides australiense]|uniref:DUF3618 domain-containing protein n=1 Tax=Nostocoides australiense Ben110 TaxID=1193182 RepID=W6JTS7_9MICO|nr:DUF3618 domain-containing protein [Tetrasphaera australiensis]MCA0291694.1 DUF3618 domain-containing protein [Actinomycetota bacterium]MCB1300425.1 DUF3618 domain-containing protein [Tetrasphaera sp.]CCH71886.1 conserved hypothetical protein [Tetrasphaera australiensis Ben110]HPF81908.1 DUF3618 domain-containing protein [Tetrasphaera australiensis]HRW02772.1 DUF3618 domain-containing protein [Tetrasphaera sp.]
MSDPSVEKLRADIAASRERLAQTVDELTTKAAPKAIVQRQTESAKARFAAATTTPSGDLRTERIAAVAAALAVVLVVRCILRRRSS